MDILVNSLNRELFLYKEKDLRVISILRNFIIFQNKVSKIQDLSME